MYEKQKIQDEVLSEEPLMSEELPSIIPVDLPAVIEPVSTVEVSIMPETIQPVSLDQAKDTIIGIPKKTAYIAFGLIGLYLFLRD